MRCCPGVIYPTVCRANHTVVGFASRTRVIGLVAILSAKRTSNRPHPHEPTWLALAGQSGYFSVQAELVIQRRQTLLVVPEVSLRLARSARAKKIPSA